MFSLFLIELKLILQTFHIDDESVFHITFQHSFISIIDILDVDNFYIRNNILLATEIQHLLSFLDAADR